MITRRDDGYEIDTSPERLDVPRVHEWLATDAYWALGRSAELMRKAIAGATCYGLYDAAGVQVGFARAVTDDATFAWLCDVYVAQPVRGLGLGTWLAQVVHDHLREHGVARLLLATRDAHGVYAKVGFAPLVQPSRWMEIDLRPTAPRRDTAPGEVNHR